MLKISHRNVLGSIHQLTISEAEREVGSMSEEIKTKADVPVKTLLNTLTTQGQSGINLAMVMIHLLVVCNLGSHSRLRCC